MLNELKQLLNKSKFIYTIDDPITDINMYSWIIRNNDTLILLQYDKTINDWCYQHYGKNMYLSDDTEYRVYFIFDMDSFLKKYEINKNWEAYLPDKLIYDKIEQCIQDFETDISGYKYDPGKNILNNELERIQSNQLNNVFQKVYILNSQKPKSHSLRLIDELKKNYMNNYMFIDKLTNGIQDAINNKYGKIFVIEENVIFHKHFIANIKNLEFPNDSRIISLGTNDFKGEPTGFYRITPDTKQDLFAILIDSSVFKEIYNTGNIESIIHTRASNCYYYLPSLVKC